MSDHLSAERLAEIREQDISWMTDNEVRELLAHIDAQAATIKERDAAITQVMEERDHAEDYADKLAYFIAPVEVIGEHSSGNNPWQNALDGGQE